MQLVKDGIVIDFLGKRNMAISISAILILAAIASVGFHGGLRYGIDFAGGTLVQLQFKTPPTISQIRKGLKSLDLGDSTIQEFGSSRDILIRVEHFEEKLEAVGNKIRRSISEVMSTETISVERVEMVGKMCRKTTRRYGSHTSLLAL